MMNRNLKRLCLATIVSFGASLAAQDTAGPDYFFKMRGQAGLNGDSGYRNAFGVSAGTSVNYAGGKVGVEAIYTYNPGSIFRADFPAEMNFPGDNVPPPTQLNSVLTQKHQADFLGLRVFYGQAINDTWGWQAGLGFYHVKARMESIGDFEFTGQGVDGAWTTVSDRSGKIIEPFVGLTYRLSESGSLEFNATMTTFKTPDVTPVYTQGAPDYERVTPVYGDKTVSNIRLEISYVFHF